MNNIRPLHSIIYLFFVLILGSCDAENSYSNQTDEEIYEKEIFTDNPQQEKIKAGNVVTLYYCLKNGNQVIASSEQSLEPSIITIPTQEKLDRFQRPLMWLGLGDSCVVHLKPEHAAAELLSYQKHFKKGDKATIIYKILKIE